MLILHRPLLRLGERALPQFAASTDSEKPPRNPCLPAVGAGSWSLVPMRHLFLLRMQALVSLGPFMTSKPAIALEEDEQQETRLCVYHLGKCGLQRKVVWRQGIRLLWRPKVSASSSACKTMTRSAPSVLWSLLTWALQPLPQPLVWQKWCRFCTHYLWFLVKFVFLYDHLFLLSLSFCPHVVWMLLKVGTVFMFSHFNKYKLNILPNVNHKRKKMNQVLPIFFIYLVVRHSFSQQIHIEYLLSAIHCCSHEDIAVNKMYISCCAALEEGDTQ